MQDPNMSNEELARRLEANENLAAQPDGADKPGKINLVTQANFDGIKVEQTDGLGVVVYDEQGQPKMSTVAKELLKQSKDDVNDKKDMTEITLSWEMMLNDLEVEVSTPTHFFLYPFDFEVMYPILISINEDYISDTYVSETTYHKSLEKADGTNKVFKPETPVRSKNFIVNLNGQVVGQMKAGEISYTFDEAPLENSRVEFHGHVNDLEVNIAVAKAQKELNSTMCENSAALYQSWKAEAESAVATITQEIDELKQSIKDGKDAADAVAKSLEDLRKELSEVDNNPAEVSRLSEAITDKEEELTSLEKEIKSANSLLEVKEDDKARGEKAITKGTEAYTKFSQLCDDTKSDFETYITELETILSNWAGAEFSESYTSRIATVKEGIEEDLNSISSSLSKLNTTEDEMIKSISTEEGKASDLSSCDETNKERAADAIVKHSAEILEVEEAMVESNLVEHIIPVAEVAAEVPNEYHALAHNLGEGRVLMRKEVAHIKGQVMEACESTEVNIGIINALEVVEMRGNEIGSASLRAAGGKKLCCRINPSGKCCNTLGGNFLTGLKFSDDNFTGGDSQARIGGWFGKWLQRIGLKSYTL